MTAELEASLNCNDRHWCLAYHSGHSVLARVSPVHPSPATTVEVAGGIHEPLLGQTHVPLHIQKYSKAVPALVMNTELPNIQIILGMDCLNANGALLGTPKRTWTRAGILFHFHKIPPLSGRAAAPKSEDFIESDKRKRGWTGVFYFISKFSGATLHGIDPLIKYWDFWALGFIRT